MKKLGVAVSIALNVLLILGIAAYWWYRRSSLSPEHPWVVFTSTSPDGKWRCVVTDIDSSKQQFTLVYSVEPARGLPLDGPRYVSYEDSGTNRPTFTWSQNRVVVRDYRKTLVATFGGGRQHWRELPPEERGAPSRPAGVKHRP